MEASLDLESWEVRLICLCLYLFIFIHILLNSPLCYLYNKGSRIHDHILFSSTKTQMYSLSQRQQMPRLNDRIHRGCPNS